MSDYRVSWEEKTKGSSSNFQKKTTTVSASSMKDARQKALGSKINNSHIDIRGFKRDR